MSSEQARVGLYNRLDDVLGKPYSDDLMSGLVADAEQLATKADLQTVLERLEERLGRIEDRMDRVDARFEGVYKTMIAAQVSLAAIITLALRLIG